MCILFALLNLVTLVFLLPRDDDCLILDSWEFDVSSLVLALVLCSLDFWDFSSDLRARSAIFLNFSSSAFLAFSSFSANR